MQIIFLPHFLDSIEVGSNKEGTNTLISKTSLLLDFISSMCHIGLIFGSLKKVSSLKEEGFYT